MKKAILLVTCMSIFHPAGGADHDSAPNIRDAVVIVVAKGINPAAGNSEAAVQGSGFFISQEGLLVTSYHLREELGATVEENTVEYEVHADSFSDPIPAKPMYASPEADIMVLYAPMGNRAVKVLQPARRDDIQLSVTPIFVGGYAGGYQYSLTPGVVTAWTGPLKPLIPSWTTNIAIQDGESGSPVVLSDGRVVATAKGADESSPSVGIVVPISFIPQQYWDSSASANAFRQSLEATPPGQEKPKVVVTSVELTSAPREQSAVFRWERSPCDRAPWKAFPIATEAGWEIDPASVKVVPHRLSGATAYSQAVVPTKDGVSVRVKIDSSGTCLRLGGTRIPTGSPAIFEGTVTYTDHPVAPQPTEKVLAEAIALDGAQVPIFRNGSTVKYYVVRPDGVREEFEPKANEVLDVSGKTVLDVNKAVKRVLH